MKKWSMLILVTLAAVTVSVSAESIFVENHSFEEPGTGKPNWVDVPGWDAAGEQLGGVEALSPSDGVYTGFLQIGSQAYNLTDHTIPGAVEYTLVYDVRKSWLGSQITVELYYDDDGGDRVSMVADVYDLPAGDNSPMEERSITVRSDDVPDAIGHKLGIQVTGGEVDVSVAAWVGFDNFRLDYESLIVTPVYPENTAPLVGTDDDLEWAVLNDWHVDLYFQATEPNFTGVAPILIDTADTTYDPGTMVNGTTYYWRLDAYEPNSIGTGFVVQTGPVWSFTIAPATPTITLQPITQTVETGSEVVLAVDGTNIDYCKWYKGGELIKDGEILLPDDDARTLTIGSAQVGDEGYYECEAWNDAGFDPSNVVRLMTKRLVGWWKMDGDVEDSIGEVFEYAPAHPGIGEDPNFVAVGMDGGAISFSLEEKPVSLENSNDYFNFFPQGYTISTWVQSTQSGWVPYVAKQQSGDTAGFLMGSAGGDGGFHTLRGHNGMNSSDGNLYSYVSVNDGQWHLVTGTFDAETKLAKVYVDGRLANTSTASSNNISPSEFVVTFGAWWYGSETSNLDGLLEDIKIWSYPLEDITIALLYTVFNPGSEICMGNPANDIAGPEVDGNGDPVPDCRVDLYDLAAFGAGWLECNIVPTCIP